MNHIRWRELDELIDILDEDGILTGRTALKSEAHSNGFFHPTVHIWCYTVNGKVLIQQRAAGKTTHPLLWDVSVAGHVGAGEDMKIAAVREIKEEIGLEIKVQELKEIGIFRSVHRHSAELIDCEFHHTFLCELKVPFSTLQIQEEEVRAVELMPLTQFAEETIGLSRPNKYVPHGSDYYSTVIRAIKGRLKVF